MYQIVIITQVVIDIIHMRKTATLTIVKERGEKDTMNKRISTQIGATKAKRKIPGDLMREKYKSLVKVKVR